MTDVKRTEIGQTKEISARAENSRPKILALVAVTLVLFLFSMRDIIATIIGFFVFEFLPLSDSPFDNLFLILSLNAGITVAFLLVMLLMVSAGIFSFRNQSKQHRFGLTTFIMTFIIVGGLVYGLGFVMAYGAELLGVPVESSYQEILISPSNFTWLNVVLFFVLLCVLAPLFEELVFRRLLFPYLESGIGTFWALILTSLLFGLAHTENDLINGSWFFAFDHLVTSTLIGFGIGIVYCFTRDIRFSILYHGLNNFFPTFILYAAAAYLGVDLSANITEIATIPTILIAIVFLPFLQMLAGGVGLIWFLINRTARISFNRAINLQKSRDQWHDIAFKVSIAIGVYSLFMVAYPVVLEPIVVEQIRNYERFVRASIILLIDGSIAIFLLIIFWKYRALLIREALETNPDIEVPDPFTQFYGQQQSSPQAPLSGSRTWPVMGQKFCGHCGSKLPESTVIRFCPECGKVLSS